MQLTYPKAPSNGVQTLRPVLQAALQTQGFGVNRQFASASPAGISLSEAYRGYSLSLDDLSQGKGLKQARVGDWHYLVFFRRGVDCRCAIGRSTRSRRVCLVEPR